jgi:hypothetical protein
LESGQVEGVPANLGPVQEENLLLNVRGQVRNARHRMRAGGTGDVRLDLDRARMFDPDTVFLINSQFHPERARAARAI